jgi:hypothetical protein
MIEHIHNKLNNSMEQSSSWEATRPQPVKNSPLFMEIECLSLQSKCPQGSLLRARLMQPRATATISPISVYMFHVTILWMALHLNTVFTSSLPNTCHITRPNLSSLYGHSDNVNAMSSVLFMSRALDDIIT